MKLYRVIIPGQADILIRAEDFDHEPDCGRVKFKRGNENAAIFTLSNIVGFVRVDENDNQ